MSIVLGRCVSLLSGAPGRRVGKLSFERKLPWRPRSSLSFLVGRQILSGKTPTASLSDPSALRAVFGGGLYLFALGLIALGIATIIRYTPTAISAFVGILLVVPIIASVLPTSYADDIGRFLPANIGTVMISAHHQRNGAFGPWVGFALLCGYAAAVLMVGGVLLVRRDA